MLAKGDIADRILELECRVAYQEETIDKLSDVVREQWAGIDQLQKMVQQLERRVAEVEDPEASGPTQRPPHY